MPTYERTNSLEENPQIKDLLQSEILISNSNNSNKWKDFVQDKIVKTVTFSNEQTIDIEFFGTKKHLVLTAEAECCDYNVFQLKNPLTYLLGATLRNIIEGNPKTYNRTDDTIRLFGIKIEYDYKILAHTLDKQSNELIESQVYELTRKNISNGYYAGYFGVNLK